MSKFIDLVGRKFSSLLVLRRADNGAFGNSRFLCLCDCGNETVVFGLNLRRGHTRSCGCLQKTVTRISHTSHGRSKTRLYIRWNSMIQRCTNINNPAYERYGGRGISVCERWFKFENFAADMGEAPLGKTLDRLNNEGSYSPDNCQWATAKEQAQNRRQRRWKKRPC